MLYSCPNHELSREMIIQNLYARLSLNNRSMLDTTMPLGEFLDEQLARARENEIIETDNIDESDDEDSPPRYELPVVPEGYVMDEETARDFLLAMIDLILRSY